MSNAWKCRCGKVLKYQDESHACSDAQSKGVELSPAEYCQKFGHQFTETEIPDTRREFTEYGSAYAEYEVDSDMVCWEVNCVCARCGQATQQSRKECKRTWINGK